MKNMNLGKYIATTLFLLISTSSVVANPQADGNGTAAIKTADGYVIVWNQQDIHFTLGLKGKDVRPMSRTGTGSIAFNVDGVVFQIQTVAISEFLKNARKQKLSDQAILIAHRDWESQYLEQSVGTKLNLTTVPQQLSNGSQALLWKYDKPKTKGSEQMYLTVVSGDSLVIVNGVVSSSVPATAVQRLLLDTISTLKVSPRPIDLLKVRESIRGSQPETVSEVEGKLQHNWRMEQVKDAVNYVSNYPAPPPFSRSGEPEATLAMEVVNLSGNPPALAEVVDSEIKEIRKGLQIGEYAEEDGHRPQNSIASWVEEIDGQKVAFIKYRTLGVKGEPRVMPRSVQHAILIRNGNLYFVHLTVLFAKHQEEVRADQIRLIKGIVRK